MEEKRTDAMLLAHLSTFASFKTLSIKSSILNAGHLFLHSCVWKPHLQWKNEPQSYLPPPPPIFFLLCGTRHECLGLSREPCILKIKGVGGVIALSGWGREVSGCGSRAICQPPKNGHSPTLALDLKMGGWYLACGGWGCKRAALTPVILFCRFSFSEDSLTLSIVRANHILMK